MKHNACHVYRARRAGILPFVAICLVVLLGLVALAVDGGYIYVSRTEMQRAADASALAGASALLESEDEAIARAIESAGLNVVARTGVSADELAVTIGSWEFDTRTFYPQTGEESVYPNAVRAVGSRLGMPLFFARAIGSDVTDVVKDATALVSSGRCAGVWGLDRIWVHGDVYTDSYDSGEGGYGEGAIYNNGDLCSCQDMDLRGDVEIHGDAMYGEGYSYNTSGSTYEVWGVVDTIVCDVYVPDFDIEGAAVNNDNATLGLTDAGRDPFPRRPNELVLIEDDNLTLSGGTYFFSSVRLSGMATLTVAGPTTIYVAGSASFTGGGIVNITEDPADLTIYSAGRSMVFSGTTAQYASVIAPQADITFLGTVDFYGTMLGQKLDFGGTFNLHVDEKVLFDLFGIKPTAPVLVE